jgi:SAM-dependent methyltransferase
MKKRKPFEGAAQIARYNARFYLAAPPACAALLALARNRALPRWVRMLLCAGAVMAAWWTLASLLVSHWVYDRSTLYRWDWIEEMLERAPVRWAHLHCGLDESSSSLRELFPQSEGEVLDFYDGTTMSEPSIALARRQQQGMPGAALGTPIDFCNFPQTDNCYDTIFLFFSAHEIRDADLRLQFFGELHRVLQCGGRVLLVEHTRDFANFVAYGPGFFHFWPRSEWRRLARDGGFRILREEAITPFVRVWLLEKP